MLNQLPLANGFRDKPANGSIKKGTSVAKGMVTRKANKLNELLTAGENTNTIKKNPNDLDGVSKQFQNVLEAYHNLLKDEQALTESTVYSNTVNELVSELRVKIGTHCVHVGSR